MLASSKLQGSASLPAMCGAAFLWAWQDQCIFGPTMASFSSRLDSGAALSTILVASVVALLAGMAMQSRLRGGEASPDFRLAIGAGILGVLGCLACAQPEATWPLLASGCALVGISMGILLLIWGYIAVAQGMERAILHLSGSWAIGLALNLAYVALPAYARWAACALLPAAASVSCIVLLSRPADSRSHIGYRDARVEAPQSRWAWGGLDPSFILTILVLCCSFGVVESFQPIPSIASGSLWASFDAVVARCVASAVLFALCLSLSLERIGWALQAALSLLVLGMVILVAPDFWEGSRTVGRILTGMGYTGFDLLVWAMVSYYSRVEGVGSLRAICAALIAEQVGIVGGLALGFASGASDAASPEAGMIAVIIVAVYALVLSCFFLIRRYLGLWPVFDALPAGAAASDEGSRIASQTSAESAIARIAEQRSLTPRESQILGLLAEGRSVPYIAELLYVSENTVKSHVRHIYEKCDFHDRQELIDRVAEARALDPATVGRR